MGFYYYEIREDDKILGKTKPFHLNDMESSWINEETKYFMKKSKHYEKVKVLLLEYQIHSD